jgi:hypothetical protein
MAENFKSKRSSLISISVVYDPIKVSSLGPRIKIGKCKKI